MEKVPADAAKPEGNNGVLGLLMHNLNTPLGVSEELETVVVA